MKPAKPPKFHRRVLMHDSDPGRAAHSRSPVMGVSMALLARLAGVSERTINARAFEWRRCLAAGIQPPPSAFDPGDWWALARYVVEHRLLARLAAQGVSLHDARERARVQAGELLDPIRELLS